MALSHRPFRSVLYLPASNARALEKSKSLPVDAIIFDLEDAVAPDMKPSARDALVAALQAGGFGPRARLVRVNGTDTPWGRDDFLAASQARPDAVLLPKVNAAKDVADAAAILDQSDPDQEIGIWAMMETPASILNAHEIATAPRMRGFVIGTNDLAKDLTVQTPADRMPMLTALQTCVLAARSAGIVCIDGVYNAFKDDDGLRTECEQGRSWGMDGKSLIHPAQVAIANEVFAPSDDEIDLARRQIAAFEMAEAQNLGVAVLDGSIVENLHVARARAILAAAEAINAMETA